MESASPLPNLPFRKKLRAGQKRVLEVACDGRRQVNAQLPTGYGKTFVNVATYSVLKHLGRFNRLLVIFPTDKQLDQFKRDGPDDLRDACVEGPLAVIDLRFHGTESIGKHRKGEAQVFAITIQSLIHEKGLAIVQNLLSTGRWMVTVDEYHHYGLDMRWGQSVLALACAFLLCMSATPRRPDDDGALGPPDVHVTYRQAVEEKAVKPLIGHSYVYRIDAVMENDEIKTFTTDDLASAVTAEEGNASPEAVERFVIRRKMRWSPKYVSPLVSHPIERMMREQIRSGQPLQALIGAMSVSHAQMVCRQVQTMFPELKVDWVGTGDNGRKSEKNAQVLEAFCPPKNMFGQREHKLDVLVHVGMAGEGLDCIHVSEVIHLNPANKTNQNDQENGRASRALLTVDGVTMIVGHINFDSSSEYTERGYIGEAIQDAMDDEDPREESSDDPDDDPKKRDDPGTSSPLPDEPLIQIWNMELERIDSGDPSVQAYERYVVSTGTVAYTNEDIKDPNHPCHAVFLDGYRNMRRKEAEMHNTESVVEQWRDSVSKALRTVTGRALRLLYGNGEKRQQGSIAGDIKRRINSRKKMEIGEVMNTNLDNLKRHYQWLVRLERLLMENKSAPEWLR